MKALALALVLLAPLSAYGLPYRGILRDAQTGRYANYTMRGSLDYDAFTGLLFLTGRFRCKPKVCPLHSGIFTGVTGTIVDVSFASKRRECRIAPTDIETFLAAGEWMPYTCTDGRSGEIGYPKLP